MYMYKIQYNDVYKKDYFFSMFSLLSYVLDGFFDLDDKVVELLFRWICQSVNLRDSFSNWIMFFLFMYMVNRVGNMFDNIGKNY